MFIEHVKHNIRESFPIMKSIVIVVGVVLTAILGAVAWLWGLNILHWFTASWRESTAFWFFIVIAVVLGLFAVFSRKSKKAVVSGVLAVVLVGTSVAMGASANYSILRDYYDNSVKKVTADAPDYDERVPYEIAVATSDSFLKGTVGEATTTKSLSDVGENGTWNTLIRTRGAFQGYESIQSMNLPLYGTALNSDIMFCDFNPSNTLRHSGAVPANNLSRAIYGQVPLNVDFSEEDSYGYCNEDGEPVVVTPLKQINGFMYPTWTFYGVALYNGATGALTIANDKAAVDAVPGPVYPMSLAATQRNSMSAAGSWWEKVVTQTVGYDAATSNPEVQLRSSGKDDSQYVTPFTPLGASSNVVAVGYVDATTATPGELNTFTISTLPEEHVRVSNSALIDKIFSAYSYKPDFANDNVGVFEITAGKDGGWVVSIGREQSLNYRAYLSVDETITLYDSAGNLIAQGVTSGGEESGEGSVELIPTELSPLTTEELKQLGNAVMDELEKRASE